MLKRLFVSCISMICVFTESYSQSSWMEWREAGLDGESAARWEDEYEELSELATHPFNINTVTKKQLEQLPFLSDKVVENILYYLYKYGPMVSKNELLGIEGIDWQTVRFLQDFIYIGPAEKEHDRFSFKHFMKYNKQELLTRLDIPLNKKAGYIYPEDGKRYLGDSFYHNLCYRMEYNKRIYIGFTAEKDAGEPFFKGPNRKGYDFYSGYLFLQDIGRIKALALGNYRANFGYGLVFNSNLFSFGRSGAIVSMNRMGRGISKYSSTAEYGYLQGAAATMKLTDRWEVSLFYSYNRLDARIEDGLIRMLKTDGYHRLPKDFEHRNTTYKHVITSNLNYKSPVVNIGLTAVYNVFDKMLNPELRKYNRYYPRGKNFCNTGVYYKYFFHPKWIFAGETAIDNKGKIATLNMLTYSPSVNTSFIVINRFADMKYSSVYGSNIWENSRQQNEFGSYIGLETSIIPCIKLSGYFDFFHFFYRRYQVDADHTSGFSNLVQMSYSPINSLMMLIKYSCKNKAKNYTDHSKEKYVLPYVRHRFQGQASYEPASRWQLKTSGEYVHTSFSGNRPSDGWLLNSTIRWEGHSFPLQVILGAACFRTQSYDSRIYMYEPGLLYSFSMPSFYGKGRRMSLNLKYIYKSRIVVHAKWGWTHYLDRNRIGTGLEEIQGSDKADVQIQLKVKW